MTDEATADPYEVHRKERLRYFWRNYLAHSIEGGLFVGGLAFVAQDSVLPRLAELLEAPPWLVGLMPALMWIGIGLPPLFVAHHIERLTRYKPLLLVTGIFQRLPFFLAALVLLLFGATRPRVALVAVVLAPILSGFFCGISITAWMELVARTLPSERRASVFAWRNIISAVIGLGAGGIIAAILNRYPGTQGYGLLHLMAFVMLVASYIGFCVIRETVRPPQNQGPPQSLAANLRSVPGLLRSAPGLRRFLVLRSFIMGQFIMIPYLAIHALRTTGQPDSFLGMLVALQMAGAIVGNFGAGWMGDRHGGKVIVQVTSLVLVLVCFGGIFAQTTPQFLAVFFLFGAGAFGSRVGLMTLSLEISPRDKRATSIGLLSLVNVISLALFSTLSGVIWSWGRGFAPGALAAAFCLALSCVLLARVTEPRKR